MYNFNRLITKYGKTPVYEVVQTGGYYDYTQGGIWVDGTETDAQFIGAVTRFGRDDLVFGEAGAYADTDRKLYAYRCIELNATVKHKTEEYTVNAKMGYDDFDEGLFIYRLVRKG